MVREFRILAGKLSLLVAILMATAWLGSASAADPASNAPSASQTAQTPAENKPHNNAATWREARSGVAGFTTVQGTESGVLMSPQGNTWRAIRNGLITPYGGALLVVVALLIGVFHQRKGMFMLAAPKTGRRMERFSFKERRAHWLVAISFVCLAFTGIVLLFGKHIFMWLLGHNLFSWLGWLSKNLHVVAGFSFVFGAAILFRFFWRDNIWHRSDAEWIRKAGGLLSHEHVPSRRFNFGEKTWFWIGLCLFGLIMAASGLVLTFPNFFDTRAAIQTAEIVHAIAACLVIAMSLGHIYMGTIGMEGAFEAMKTGEVDEAWAKEHHELWYQEKLAKQNAQGGKA